MILEKLIIKNFMRIREAELDFSDKTIVGIRAIGMDDPERSNYIGKTTLIEAVGYCITGNSRADKDIELIHDGESAMEVTTIWKDVNGNSHKIRRGRDENNTGLIEVGFADKGKEPQQAIDDLFGITSEDFEQIFYFQQQEIHTFMNETADKKKKKLMKWLKNDHWRDKEQAVLDDVKQKKAEIHEKQIMIRNAEIAVGDEQKVMDEYSGAMTSRGIEANALLSLKKQIEESSGMSKAEYKKLDAQVQKIIARIEVCNTKRDERKECEERLALIVVPEKYSSMDVVNAEKKKYQDGQLKLREEVFNVLAEEKALQLKLEALESNKGICPILKKSCDLIKPEGDREKIEGVIAELKEKVTKGNTKIAVCTQQLKYLNEVEVNLGNIERLKRRISDTPDYDTEILELGREMDELTEKMKAYDEEAEDRISELKLEASQMEERISDLNRQIGSLEHKMKLVEENKEMLAKTRSEILDLNTELGDLQYLAFMFGRNGIPSLEIENAFTEIETDVNYILTQINPAIQVTIRPDKELQAWEPNCPTCGYSFPKGYRKTSCEQCDTPRFKKRKDELTFIVLDNGKERSFRMCSGGLKTVISLAVRVALSLLVKRQNKTNFSTIFLDEIDSALDAVHREQIKDLVVRVLVNQLGFSQVLWISHDKTISQSVPHTILVKGYEKYSELEWA